MHLSSHPGVRPHNLKKRKKAEKTSTSLRGDTPLGPHRTENLQKESDIQREEGHITPDPSMMILDQSLEPLDNDPVMLKRRAQSNPRPPARRKKRKITQHTDQPSRCEKDETSNPGAFSPHNARSMATGISSNSTASGYLEAINRTPIPFDNEPYPMYTPNELSTIAGHGVINPAPLPHLDIEEQCRKQAQYESLPLTTPSMEDGSFVGRFLQSQDFVDEIHSELLNEHDRLNGHAMATSTILAMEQPLRGSRPMGPKLEPSELDPCPPMLLGDKLRSQLPTELYRVKSVLLDSPTGPDVETPIKPIDPDTHLSSDRGPSLSSPSL